MSKSAPPFGEAWLFSFPFWIMVDPADPPQIIDTHVDSIKVRAYPPFRSGPANFIPMPYINPHAIPWVQGARPNIASDYRIFSLATLPLLGADSNAKAGIQLIWGETWDEQPPHSPMDSIRLDVAKSHHAIPDFLQSVALRLLQYLRIISGQWWIGRSADAMLGYVRNSFPIDEDGKPLEPSTGYATARTISGFEHPVDNVAWTEAIARLSAGELPRESTLLVLDSYYYAAAGDFRAAVLSISQALEQEVERTFACLWGATTEAPFKRGRVMRGSGLIDHLTSDLERLASRRFDTEHPDTFGLIEDIWLARGNVAHGGSAEFYRQRHRHIVDNEMAVRFAESARQCIDWLLELCDT